LERGFLVKNGRAEILCFPLVAKSDYIFYNVATKRRLL